MQLRVRGIDSAEVESIRRGGPDAYGREAERHSAEGPANPCRHCLELIDEGDSKLVLAHRPFPTLQPYAETGPIFLHASPCERYEADELPGWFAFLDPAIVRGYGADHWIRYETGAVVQGSALTDVCRGILEDTSIAYVHIRSKFNCFQCRVDRAEISNFSGQRPVHA